MQKYPDFHPQIGKMNYLYIQHNTIFIVLNMYYWCELCCFSSRQLNVMKRHLNIQNNLLTIRIEKEEKIHSVNKCTKNYKKYQMLVYIN